MGFEEESAAPWSRERTVCSQEIWYEYILCVVHTASAYNCVQVQLCMHDTVNKISTICSYKGLAVLKIHVQRCASGKNKKADIHVHVPLCVSNYTCLTLALKYSCQRFNR